MTPRRPHAQIHLPPLSADYALTLVGIFERAIEAVWRAHGDAMAQLRTQREDHRTTDPEFVDCGNPDAPDNTSF